MAINKATFYKVIKKSCPSVVASSKVTLSVDGIIDTAIAYGCTDAQLAYILATTYHETDFTMLPIREYGRGRGRKYGRSHPETGQTYYGRGYVQLTWHFNYVRATKELGVDFENNPDLVMKPQFAAQILVHGCMEGWFTGKALRDTVDEGTFEEFKDSRRVVNGLDKASKIAKHAQTFLKAIKQSRVVNDNPLTDSRTMRGAGTAGSAGTAIVVKEVVEVVEKQETALSSGNIIAITIGIVVIVGALVAAYARWDDAGRPKLF